MIPKILLQTSKDPYPQYVNDMWTERTDDSWKIEWFDDAAILKFFDDNPLPEFPNIKEVFNSFVDGGHKADLFRYYYLYLNGGFFIDSDVMLHVHMNELYSPEHDHIFVFADVGCNRKFHPEIDSPIIFNGIMGCIPKSKIIYDALMNAYKVKLRLLEKQRLYFVYMLYVISEKHKGSYNIRYYNEITYNDIGPVSHTLDPLQNNKVIATHYFTGKKLVPKQKLYEEHAKKDVTFFTTFNDSGYKLYGRAWVKTFIEIANNNPGIKARVYYQNFEPDLLHEAIEYVDFDKAIPHHNAWKKLYAVKSLGTHGSYTRANVIRFSHKAFVMNHMWSTTEQGYAVWLDGDCVFKRADFSLFPADVIYDSYLLACQVESRDDTTVKHVESGVIIFDCGHEDKTNFLNKFTELYEVKNITEMPTDNVDIHGNNNIPWEEYGPYDGFIIHKTLSETGINFIDLNQIEHDSRKAEFSGDPNTTFLHPNLNTRFIHNIGHVGKNVYETLNRDLGIENDFTWSHSQTDAMTFKNVNHDELFSDVVEIDTGYENFKFSYFIHNPTKDGIISRHLYLGDPWEPHISKLLFESMPKTGIFVDIGSNIGWHTKVAQEHGINVIAFEPQPLNFKLLTQNCAKEGTILHNLALGEKEETLLIVRDTGNYGNSYISEHGTDEVRVVRLDDMIDEVTASNVYAVKIDVQGFEIQVLQGGKKFFEALPKGAVVILEINPAKLQNDLNIIRELASKFTKSFVTEGYNPTKGDFEEAVEFCKDENGNYNPNMEFDYVLIK